MFRRESRKEIKELTNEEKLNLLKKTQERIVELGNEGLSSEQILDRLRKENRLGVLAR